MRFSPPLSLSCPRIPGGVLRNTKAMIRQDVALCATPRYDAREYVPAKKFPENDALYLLENRTRHERNRKKCKKRNDETKEVGDLKEEDLF